MSRYGDIRVCPVCGAFVEDEVHCGNKTKLLLNRSTRVWLSKLLTLILRHEAPSLGVELDSEGWADLSRVVEVVRERAGAHWVREEHVEAVAATDPKGRFEVVDRRIRARYGHSLPVSPKLEEDREVEVLYHGTSAASVAKILREGLLPMKRRWVHLSASVEDAVEVGRRKSKNVIVLRIDVSRLREVGHRVYRASPRVYVTDYVPPSCIEVLPRP